MKNSDNKAIILRPHHLLCTQGYSGHGYSPEFVENMDRVVDRLRNGDDLIKITYSTDELCSKCPNKLGEDCCETQDKVKWFDDRVVEYFDIEEKEYHYREIIKEIDDKMTGEMMDVICSECSWYPISSCRKRILEEKPSSGRE